MNYKLGHLSQKYQPIVILLVCSTILRLYQIGSESLWLDEYFSIRDAITLNLGTRPLYYLLLHIWMRFGGTEVDAWLRLLSVPFSVASTWLTYKIAQLAISERTATIAAFMTAVSPLFVGYGQEIRMYALSTFLTLLGTLALVNILKMPTRLKVLGWALLRWLAVMTTPLNIFLLLPDFLICAWQFRKQLRRLWMIACGMFFILLATLPSVLLLKTKAPEFVTDWVSYQPKPGVRRIAGMLTEFTIFWPFTDLPYTDDLTFAPGSIGQPEIMWFYYLMSTAVVSLFLIWGLFKIVQTARRKSFFHKTFWIACWGFIPVMMILIASYVSSTIWFARYLLFVAPYFIILLAATFEYVWTNYRKVAIAVAAIYMIGVSGGLVHYYTQPYHDDWKGVANTIQAEEQPGDLIGLYPYDWDPQYTLPRYYRGGLPIVLMAGDQSELTQPLVGSETELAEAMLEHLQPTSGRYWLVVYHSRDTVTPALTEAIEERYTLSRLQTFSNSVNDPIYLYLVESTESEQAQ
jgi:mannosyltransferase